MLCVKILNQVSWLENPCQPPSSFKWLSNFLDGTLQKECGFHADWWNVLFLWFLQVQQEPTLTCYCMRVAGSLLGDPGLRKQTIKTSCESTWLSGTWCSRWELLCCSTHIETPSVEQFGSIRRPPKPTTNRQPPGNVDWCVWCEGMRRCQFI